MIDEMTFQGGQEIAPQFALFRVHGQETPVSQKAGEKRLREVFGILPAVAGAAKKSVNRSPVDRAKFLEGGFGIIRQRDDEAPAGRRK